MSALKDILSEELENSIRMKKKYEQELAGLPKGAIRGKIINGHKYYYLALRNGKKVSDLYLGKLSEEEAGKYKEAKELRAKYRKAISELSEQIKTLKRALNAK